MKKRGNLTSTGLRVSASELAQMGVCERQMVFEQHYGKRRTQVQRQAIRRGQHVHRRFYRDRHLDESAKWHSVTTTRMASILYGWLKQAVRSTLSPLRWCIALWVKVMERSNGS